jgi:hypothetical protein
VTTRRVQRIDIVPRPSDQSEGPADGEDQRADQPTQSRSEPPDNQADAEPDIGDDERVAQLFEQARKIEAAHGGRKQHLVPASYLRRWAEDGRVRVTEVETRHSYVAKPEKVGLETDFYRLEADGIDPDEVPPLAMEVLLSEKATPNSA